MQSPTPNPKPDIRVTVADKTVFASGAIVLGSEQNEWSLLIDALNYRFVFEDQGGQTARVELASHDNLASTMRLIDWVNPLGISYTLPRVATVQGVDMDITFYVQSIGERPSFNRLVTYSVIAS